MKTMKTISLLLLVALLSATMFNCSDSDDPKGNTMNITSIDPESPASLSFSEFVIIEYDYNIESSEGARMWVIPYTDGDDSPGYLYSSSDIYTGSGARQVGVSVKDGGEGPVTVDQLRVVMKTPDQSETLFDQYLNVDFTFGE